MRMFGQSPMMQHANPGNSRINIRVALPNTHPSLRVVGSIEESGKQWIVIGLNIAKGRFTLHWGLKNWLPIDKRLFELIKPPFQDSVGGANHIDTPFVTPSNYDPSISQLIRPMMELEGLALDAWQLVLLDWAKLEQAGLDRIDFVIEKVGQNHWIKANNMADFELDISQMSRDEFFVKQSIPRWNEYELVKIYEIPFQQRLCNLLVGVKTDDMKIRLEFYCDAQPLLRLHWGACSSTDMSSWYTVSSTQIRQLAEFDTIKVDERAAETSFRYVTPDDSLQICVVEIEGPGVPDSIGFVLRESNGPQWIKCNDGDFLLSLPQRPEWQQACKKQAEIAAAEETKRQMENCRWEQAINDFHKSRPLREALATMRFCTFKLNEGIGEIDCILYVENEEDGGRIILKLEALTKCAMKLHWGCVIEGAKTSRRGKNARWVCPNEHIWPPDTIVIDPKQSVQTSMEKTDEFRYHLNIVFPATVTRGSTEHECTFVTEYKAVVCVLRDVREDRWYKAAEGHDLYILLRNPHSNEWKGLHKGLVDKIVEAEVEWDHMTLMHRYNLCHDLVSEHYKKSLADCTEEGKNPHCTDSQAVNSEHAFWAWIFTWNRFSFLGWLDWQRQYNTKPRDLSHACETLSCTVASLWKQLPTYRLWLRLTLTTMGRGGSAGQAIRDRILDIMHKHQIPERSDNFYEQWHQKLHNNTTPDDIGICRAVIRYLQSGGHMGAYWEELNRHGINAEKLSSYDRPVTLQPFLVHCDRSALIYDLERYLEILQSVHDAVDLHHSAQRVKHCLTGEAASLIDHVLWESKQETTPHFDELCQRVHRLHRVRCSIADILDSYTSNNSKMVRDLLLLDLGMETQQSVLMQASHSQGSTRQWIQLLMEFIEIVSRHNPSDQEWVVLACDWRALAFSAVEGRYVNDSRLNALLLKALIDRAARAVGDIMDLFQLRLGEPSLYLGSQAGVEKSKLNTFVDEVLRGTILFSISTCIKHLEPLIRSQAEMPPWQIISWVPQIKGVLTSVKALTGLQEVLFHTPTILISDAVNGEEEIPSGVQGVLVRSAINAPDILSHIAVRARNAQCLLAVCYDSDFLAEWEANYQGNWVELNVIMGGTNLSCSLSQRVNVNDDQITEPTSASDEDRGQQTPKGEDLHEMYSSKRSPPHAVQKPSGEKGTREQLRIDRHGSSSGIIRLKTSIELRKSSSCFFVCVQDFNRKYVGSKSLNLQVLRDKLDFIHTPRAFALPYGSLQKALTSSENVNTILPQIEKVIIDLATDLDTNNISSIFTMVRNLLLSMEEPVQSQEELMSLWPKIDHSADNIVNKSMKDLFIDGGQEKCWKAICSVWASMFAMRPWISLIKAGRSFMDLNMAVLVQELVPADYAFVVHTRNPFEDRTESKSKRQMYGELVVGLGEVLVANYPGRALSWIMNEGESARILAFPAKSLALHSEGSLIFRSDSNAEDLDGFAGAGLFESIPAIKPRRTTVSYSRCPLITEHELRQSLVERIGNLSFQIEDVFGTPMDIEGCVCDNKIVIVQSRPQV